MAAEEHAKLAVNLTGMGLDEGNTFITMQVHDNTTPEYMCSLPLMTETTWMTHLSSSSHDTNKTYYSNNKLTLLYNKHLLNFVVNSNTSQFSSSSQGGRAKAINIDISLTDMHGNRTQEIVRYLGHRRFPIQVRLCCVVDDDGNRCGAGEAPKKKTEIMESSRVVGSGSLKGQPVFEMEDEYGQVHNIIIYIFIY